MPYIGANIGYAYGHPFHDTWKPRPKPASSSIANATTFVYLSVEYQFFFRPAQHDARRVPATASSCTDWALGFRF